jgi:hypothetical protein
MRLWVVALCLAFVCGCGRDTRRLPAGDAGVAPRVDAGFASADAGTFPGFDAGTFPGFDAGGPIRVDAGPARTDAGRPDAGPSRRDAGRPDAGPLPFPDGGSFFPCATDVDCPGGRCCPLALGLPFGLCMDVAVCPPPM